MIRIGWIMCENVFNSLIWMQSNGICPHQCNQKESWTELYKVNKCCCCFYLEGGASLRWRLVVLHTCRPSCWQRPSSRPNGKKISWQSVFCLKILCWPGISTNTKQGRIKSKVFPQPASRMYRTLNVLLIAIWARQWLKKKKKALLVDVLGCKQKPQTDCWAGNNIPTQCWTHSNPLFVPINHLETKRRGNRAQVETLISRLSLCETTETC